jgi:hypothetical protein
LELDIRTCEFQKRSQMAWVYVLQHGEEELFKIGRTRGDVEKRRKDLSTGNPVELTLFDSIETERDNVVENYLHKKLFAFHSKDSDAREFFAISPEELIGFIDETRAFIAEYLPLLDETERLKELDPDDTVRQPDEEILKVYEELQRAREQINLLKFEEEVLANKIKKYIGQSRGIEGIATWLGKITSRLDQSALREKYPEAYEECQKESKSRVFKLE